MNDTNVLLTHPTAIAPIQADLDAINAALGELSLGAPVPSVPEPESSSTGLPTPPGRAEAIQLAMAVLNDAKVSFCLFASLDDPKANMRWTHGQRSSYAVDTEATSKEVLSVKQQLLAVALKQLSVGYSGGLSVFRHDGMPLAIFTNGKVRDLTATTVKEVVS